MYDIWSVLQWWDNWQLRILVLGSLGLQWFLLLAAPMRKYTIPRAFRTCIWLAYISSDALAIYALATLFNRHARASSASCGGAGSMQHQSSILEVLWAPILLIHLGGQQEMTGYEIEDNELWTRHTVTLVSQVAVAVYAFCKSWPSSSDWKLLAAAVLLFVVGVASFSEKPFALNRAKIERLAAVSAWVQGTKKPSKWRDRISKFFFFEEGILGFFRRTPETGGEDGGRRNQVALSWPSLCGGKERRNKQKPAVVALSETDKVLMVLSDMSLLAAAKDLVARKKAGSMEDVLPHLKIAEKALPGWLRGAFAFIYTRATVVVTPLYLVYHLLVVPILHIAALTLFATSDKHPYKRADVKITYIILCLTAALDVFAVFVRLLLYRLMSMTKVPALCETVPRYNVIDAALQEGDKSSGWIYMCARRTGLDRFQKPELGNKYKIVAQTVVADLVEKARDRDLASYRIFDSNNWALGTDLQQLCGPETKKSLCDVSFDRSVLLWHIATDLCFRCIEEGEGEIKGGGEQQHRGRGTPLALPLRTDEAPEVAPLVPDAPEVLDAPLMPDAPEVLDAPLMPDAPLVPEGKGEGEIKGGGGRQALQLQMDCTVAISNYMAHLLNFNPQMLLTGSRHHLISEAMKEVKSCFLSKKDKLIQKKQVRELIDDIVDNEERKLVTNRHDATSQVFHIIEACKLAKELLDMPDHKKRWMLMYRVWLGMLCYSASMCRGYLHAKSLGEGGQFLSFVWLVLSLKGAKSLADKLQMPLKTSDDNAESKAPAT